MQAQIEQWLIAQNIPFSDMFALIVALCALGFAAWFIYLLVYFLMRRTLQPWLAKSGKVFLQFLSASQFFLILNFFALSLMLQKLWHQFLTPGAFSQSIEIGLSIWTLINLLLLFNITLAVFTRWAYAKQFAVHFPLRGLVQTAKIIATIGTCLIILSMVLGQSPLILLSGLGAMTAVLMLVFKDPILGLVAGIQLSANDMLAVGDWLEMSSYNADGEVIEIGLTTVKIKNWDNTVTTVPTYSLISQSFKNWRPMERSGGRRIKRSFMVDVSSVRFLNEDDIQRLSLNPMLSDYFKLKEKEIDQYNAKYSDLSIGINGRRLTNLGTFRAYLVNYLNTNPNVNQKLTHMVRQLEPTNNGVPMEIYCFSNNTSWIPYEGIQSDIFDHVFAVIGEFDLRVHQSPSGHDFQALAQSKDTVTEPTSLGDPDD